jgi:hypothetical protein
MATEKALNEARAYHIPDFFASSPGRSSMATIAMALGKIGNVMAGLPGNDAADIVQKNVDVYYRQQKERVDNLFSVAKLSGESEDNLRQAYASRLATMQIQHGATNLALADRIAEIAAQNKGRVDVAKAAEAAAQLRQDGTEAIEKGRNAIAEISLKRSQAVKNYAEAAYAKERAENSGVKINIGEVKDVDTRFNALEKQNSGTQGLMTRYEKTQAIASRLRDALASKDPNAIRAAVAMAKEEGGAALSGGKTTAYAGKTLGQMQTLKDQVQSQLGGITGAPPAGFADKLLTVMEGAAEGAREELDSQRGRVMQGELGPNGLAASPAQKQRVLGHMARIYGTVKNSNGTPRYEEGAGAPAAGAAPAGALPAGIPAGSAIVPGKTYKGKPVYRSPDGKFHSAD